jgi:hypothetical protein
MELKGQVERLEEGIERKHQDKSTNGGPRNPAVTKELEHFRVLLAETAQSVCSLKAELRTKAGHLDTNEALGLLEREISRLRTDAVGKQLLHASLNTKVDQRDLNRIAALIANGELEGLSPFV